MGPTANRRQAASLTTSQARSTTRADDKRTEPIEGDAMPRRVNAHPDEGGGTPTESAANRAPVVLVYVPGLGEPPNAADAFANRFTIALDEESPVAAATYHVEPPTSGEAVSAPDAVPRRVVEVLNGNSRPVVDIY